MSFRTLQGRRGGTELLSEEERLLLLRLLAELEEVEELRLLGKEEEEDLALLMDKELLLYMLL